MPSVCNMVGLPSLSELTVHVTLIWLKYYNKQKKIMNQSLQIVNKESATLLFLVQLTDL